MNTKRPMFQSSITGKIVTKKYATVHPKTTLKHMVPVKKTKNK